MSSQWVNKYAILRDLSLAQGCVPVDVAGTVGAGDRPPSQNLIEETEEDFYRSWVGGDADFTAPDIGLIKHMLDEVRKHDTSADEENDDIIQISKMNPLCEEFKPNHQAPVEKSVCQKSIEKPIEKPKKKRPRNVAVQSLLQNVKENINTVNNIDAVKLLKPTDFKSKPDVVSDAVDKVSSWLETHKDKTPTKKNNNKLQLTLDPCSMFKKKQSPGSIKEAVKEVKTNNSSHEYGKYVPSNNAAEYYRKFLECSRMKQMVQENVWTKVERQMKEIDERRAAEAELFAMSLALCRDEEPLGPRPQLTSPGSQPGSSGTELTSPGSQHESSGKDLTSPGSQHESSGKDPTSPGSQHESSGKDLTSPGSQHESSGNDLTSPGSQPGSSGTELTSPGSQLESLGTELTSTESQPENSGTELISPGSQPESSGTELTNLGSLPASSGALPESPGSQPESLGSQSAGLGPPINVPRSLFTNISQLQKLDVIWLPRPRHELRAPCRACALRARTTDHAHTAADQHTDNNWRNETKDNEECNQVEDSWRNRKTTVDNNKSDNCMNQAVNVADDESEQKTENWRNQNNIVDDSSWRNVSKTIARTDIRNSEAKNTDNVDVYDDEDDIDAWRYEILGDEDAEFDEETGKIETCNNNSNITSSSTSTLIL